MSGCFRYRFRVRYQECDAQKIVFNARWGDYVDIAATELIRVALGGPEKTDWKLARQLIEWKASARFDDVLEARMTTAKVGTTSMTMATTFFRLPEETPLVHVETVYVMTDHVTGAKRAITDEERAKLGPGAVDALVDCTGDAR